METPDSIARHIIAPYLPEIPPAYISDHTDMGLDRILIFDLPAYLRSLPDGGGKYDQMTDDMMTRAYDHIVDIASRIGCGQYFMLLNFYVPAWLEEAVAILLGTSAASEADDRMIETDRAAINQILHGVEQKALQSRQLVDSIAFHTYRA